MIIISNQQRIKEIINHWNPIDINPLPEDEYEIEIKLILDLFTGAEEDDIDETIGRKINEIFTNQFGRLFQKTFEECNLISNRIKISLETG